MSENFQHAERTRVCVYGSRLSHCPFFLFLSVLHKMVFRERAKKNSPYAEKEEGGVGAEKKYFWNPVSLSFLLLCNRLKDFSDACREGGKTKKGLVRCAVLSRFSVSEIIKNSVSKNLSCVTFAFLEKPSSICSVVTIPISFAPLSCSINFHPKLSS